MSDRQTSARVGVRELRQNLSVYLDRVKDGESLEVTEHGHPVARLTPLESPDRSPYARLVADGRVTEPRGELMDVLPPPPINLPPGAPTLTEILLERRRTERS